MTTGAMETPKRNPQPSFKTTGCVEWLWLEMKSLLGPPPQALFRPLGADPLYKGITTRSKKLRVTKCIATRSKDATSSSWPYY